MWKFGISNLSALCKCCCEMICYLSVQDSGTVLWKYSSGVPFFSSPYCSNFCVFIGAVNGHIVGISHSGDQVGVKKKTFPLRKKN